MWQLCPKCKGEQGYEEYTTPQDSYWKTCGVCCGTGLISELTGKPPVKDVKVVDNKTKWRDLGYGG